MIFRCDQCGQNRDAKTRKTQSYRLGLDAHEASRH
jgi:hypothetical protein